MCSNIVCVQHTLRISKAGSNKTFIMLTIAPEATLLVVVIVGFGGIEVE